MKTVLITRPLPAASRWQHSLTAAGWQSQIISCMDIVPVADVQGLQAIKNVILEFDRFDKVIFVSVNAVSQALAWLDQYWPQLPARQAYFAIGETTAEALREADIYPEALGQADGPMNSETLLGAPQLQAIGGENILVFKGVGGRRLIQDTLAARGAEVGECALYRRELPETAAADLALWLDSTPPGNRVIACHSGESLVNLVDAAAATGRKPLLLEQSIVVPGERVGHLAYELGFTKVWPAINASDGAMLAGLNQYLSAKVTGR